MPPKSSVELRFATKAIHAGQEPDKATGSVTIPIYQTSTYAQPEPGREGPYVYSRTANPTRTALEKNLATLENGRYGLAVSSGMAATNTVLMLASKGGHVSAADDGYGRRYRVLPRDLLHFGVSSDYGHGRDP